MDRSESTTTGHESSANDLGVLAEMLRQSERVLNHQVRALEEHDDKSEHMLTLAVAVLGGGAALATLTIQSLRGQVDTWFLTLLALSGFFNFGALFLFLGSYAGFQRHTEILIGPSLEWLVSKSNDSSWTLLDSYLSVLKDVPDYYRWNTGREMALAQIRRWGTYSLSAAVVTYGSAFLYIVSRGMGGV